MSDPAIPLAAVVAEPVDPDPIAPKTIAPVIDYGPSSQPSLKQLAKNAAVWSFVGYSGSVGLRLASNMVLTRLLFPGAYALMGLAQIFINGLQQTIPTDIGIDTGAGTIQSIHTHDDTGVVHLESSQSRTFTLGEFFGVWGVRFTPSCVGGYCNDGQNQIRVYVNGEEQTGTASDIPLDDQSVIVVTFGTQKQLPDPIPSTFDFSTIQP